ncbi:cell filamentation protein Fic [Candidatus Gracilibacteria bacterium]|nr:cell filamentation protein Fic [Candidatus Gracilibacteria bacterium]
METISYKDISTNTTIPNIIFYNDTIWMNQEQIGNLYGKAKNTISEHIKKIYSDKELDIANTSQNESKFGISEFTTENSFKKPKIYYNLQIIIAVGFKVNSPQAISFRTWANNIINQYIGKGYALDDERLKGGKTFGGKRDYEGLMERVRSIRFDERNIYEKIKDLFTTAVDYDKSSIEASDFFQTIQNKFHYAIVGMTSPEILLNRVDSKKPALGMQFYAKNNITLTEAKVGKNYLLEDELRKLYLLCEQFFAFAELQYAYERDLGMDDWKKYLDELLKINKLEVLEGKGSVSRENAENYVKKQMADYQQKWGSLEAYIEGADYLLDINNKQ